jgi:hypothetical protein
MPMHDAYIPAGATTAPIAFRESGVPEAIRSLSTLAPPDYVDLFTVVTGAARGTSPEEWARAVAEEAAGRGGQVAWRVLLGLRLDPRPSPDRVAGWTIAGRGRDWLRLAAASWFMTAELVFQVGDERLSVATLIRYDRPIAARIWPPLAAVVHRRSMPGLLRHAARALDGLHGRARRRAAP